jgi:hypothetical protein
MSLRQLLHKPLTTPLALGVIVLIFGAWFAIQIRYDSTHYLAGMQDEARSSRAFSIGMELINTVNSTNLVGTTKEFTADLASFLDPIPWAQEPYPRVNVDRPRGEDPRHCVHVILTNDLGHALDLLLQDEYARGDIRFRLLSYRTITQPVAPPNGGPTTSVGDSGASEGRHR